MKNQTTSPHDAEKEFHDFMHEVGVPPHTDYPSADSQLHRYRIEGDKPGRKNGWYVLHLSPCPVGVCGDWKTDSKHTWYGTDRDADSLTSTEMKKLRRQIAKAVKQQEKEREQLQLNVSSLCEAQWSTLSQVDPYHPYLQAKGVRPHEIRQKEQSLIIPLRDVSGRIFSWQTIAPDGKKRFRKDGRIIGCFHQIGGIRERKTTLFIVEGYATGATIHERMPEIMNDFVDTSKLPNVDDYAVIVAFNAGNLPRVAAAVRARYPTNPIAIVADNDHHTKDNPGLTKANAAKEVCHAQLIVPHFCPGDKGTDFNDFFQQQRGHNSVER